jgi:drug/metabolite transporter (DMT)-like permease
MKNKNQMLGAGSLLLSAFIYSFFGVLTRAVGFSLPLFYSSWVRNLLMLAILAIPLFVAKKWINVNRRDFIWIFIRSCGGLTSFVGSYVSFFYIPLGVALFIFYASSAIGGYIFGKILYHEKLTKIKIFSLILALSGLFLVNSVDFPKEHLIYALYAFLGGIGNAVWCTFSKKVSDKYSSLQLNFLDTINFIIIPFSLSIIIREKWVAPQFSMLWFYMLLFVLMFIATGQLMVRGFKFLDAQIGSLIMLSEIIFGVILGFILFKETLSLMTLFGGSLIILAIALPEVKWKKYEK